jgi:hypothetical protein
MLSYFIVFITPLRCWSRDFILSGPVIFSFFFLCRLFLLAGRFLLTRLFPLVRFSGLLRKRLLLWSRLISLGSGFLFS